MFFKIGVLKNFAIFAGKQMLESLFNKVHSKIFKNILFYRTPTVAASGFMNYTHFFISITFKTYIG